MNDDVKNASVEIEKEREETKQLEAGAVEIEKTEKGVKVKGKYSSIGAVVGFVVAGLVVVGVVFAGLMVVAKLTGIVGAIK